jgi:hypothetical protein
MAGIEPVFIELQCAQQDERARGKAPCASRSNGNVQASDRTATRAYDKARRQADLAGWKLKEVTTNGRFRAMVCPACVALMEGKQ